MQCQGALQCWGPTFLYCMQPHNSFSHRALQNVAPGLCRSYNHFSPLPSIFWVVQTPPTIPLCTTHDVLQGMMKSCKIFKKILEILENNTKSLKIKPGIHYQENNHYDFKFHNGTLIITRCPQQDVTKKPFVLCSTLAYANINEVIT